jgi:hypothetical protein
MNNVKELRKELSKLFDGVKNKQIEIQQGKAMVATSNAILKSIQLELEHNKFVGAKKKKIDWLS